MSHIYARGLLAVAVAVAMLALSVTGLRAQQADTKPAAEDPVVAIVDGSKVHLSELQAAQAALPDQLKGQPLEQIYGALLKRLVDRRLLANAAEKEKLADTPAVKRRLELARVQILAESWLYGQIEPAVTPEKLRERYEKEKPGQKGEEEVHARHILLKSEAEAQAVLAKIRRGADFVEMAKQHSTGPSGKTGGDLGFFKRQEMVPAFSEVAFKLQAGDISDPVQSRYGWHIIKVEARRQSAGPSFAEREPHMRQLIAQEVITRKLDKLRSGAEIKRFLPDGKTYEPAAAQPTPKAPPQTPKPVVKE